MLKYIFRRILIFIPTLFIISLLAFVISVNAPGDPVEALFSGGEGGGSVEVAFEDGNVFLCLFLGS